MKQEITELFNQLSQIEGLSLPCRKSEIRKFKASLDKADGGLPLQIYVGSCPDYSHRGGLYTHESLGNGVPLLTSFHLEYAGRFLPILDRFHVPYVYTIMIADVEASDSYFQRRFAGGSEETFLEKCEDSRIATELRLMELVESAELQGRLVSSSFYMEFGRERFSDCQQAYRDLLSKRYREDSSFYNRVVGDTSKRMALYRKMYPEVVNGYGFLSREKEEFIISRTIRTMAQYLALGRFISQKGEHVVIINHPTRNIGLYNDGNKFSLLGDGSRPQPTIPILEMQKEVY